MAEPAGELPEPGLTAEQVIDPSSVGGDPGRNEIRASLFEAVELRCEKRSKSEIFKFENESTSGSCAEVAGQAASDGTVWRTGTPGHTWS